MDMVHIEVFVKLLDASLSEMGIKQEGTMSSAWIAPVDISRWFQSIDNVTGEECLIIHFTDGDSLCVYHSVEEFKNKMKRAGVEIV